MAGAREEALREDAWTVPGAAVTRAGTGRWKATVRLAGRFEGRPDGGREYVARGERSVTVTDEALASWLAGARHSMFLSLHCRVRAGEWLVDGATPILAMADSASPAPDLSGMRDAGADPAFLARLAGIRREFEDGFWPEYNALVGEDDPPPGTAPSSRMCRVTSAVLCSILRADMPGGNWRVAGGHPSVNYPHMANEFLRRHDGLDGGMWVAGREEWDGHYWVEGTLDGEAVIVDLTGDQYGGDAVAVLPVGDPRYRANLKAGVVARDLRQRSTAAMVAAHGHGRGLLGVAGPAPGR